MDRILPPWERTVIVHISSSCKLLRQIHKITYLLWTTEKSRNFARMLSTPGGLRMDAYTELLFVCLNN